MPTAAIVASTVVVTTRRRLGSSCELFGMADFMMIVRILFEDDLLDLRPERTEKALFWISADQATFPVDRSLPFAPGDPDVGHLGLARAVHDAPHDGHLHRGSVLARDRLDGPREFDHLDLRAPARRAGRDLEALLADPERLEDRPTDRHL